MNNTFVAIQFLTQYFDKFLEKTKKNRKKQRKPPKMQFWYICIVFSIFSIVSKEFSFSKVFWTRSTFNVLILQSLIFLLESTLVLFVFKINSKKKKTWGTNVLVSKPHFSYKYQSTVKKRGKRKFWGNSKEKKKTLRDRSFHLFQRQAATPSLYQKQRNPSPKTRGHDRSFPHFP